MPSSPNECELIAIATIQTKRPFLITLTTQERRRLFKMGPKSLSFVNNSHMTAQSNADILPVSFDLSGYKQDYQLAMALSDIHARLQQLDEQVDDTLMAVGGELMRSSLSVHDYVKTAAKHRPGLRGVAQSLLARE
ncbi:MAG: hypothetical protein AAF289_08855 [Cyanobacteria bacterium P01_A01_bin.135]